MGRGSSSRGSSSRRSSTRRSSFRRNPPLLLPPEPAVCGFHRVATDAAGGGGERHRVNIDANEAYRLNQRYESAPRDVKLPEHEAARNSFAAEPPEWFLRDSVSPPSSDDEDAARSDSELYKRLPEEIPHQGWRKKGPDGGSGGDDGSSSAPVVIID